jgi:hypothetical protein
LTLPLDSELLPTPSGNTRLADSEIPGLMLTSSEAGPNGLQAVVDLVHGLGFDICEAAAGGRIVIAGTEPRLGVALEAGAVLSMHLSATTHHIGATLGDVAEDLAALVASADEEVPLPRDAATWIPILVSSLNDAVSIQDSAGHQLALAITTPQLAEPWWPLGEPPGPVDPTAPFLSAVAVSLLLHRLTVDLAVGVPHLAGIDEVVVREAIFPATGSLARKVPRDGSAPCSLGDLGGAISDTAAAVQSALFSTGIWEQFAKAIQKADPPNFAKKYVKAARLINVLLAVLKLISVSYMFVGEATPVDGAELQRTRHPDENGDRLDVLAHFFMKEPPAAWANCVRLALNALLLDFDLPSAGPLATLPVTWSLGRGTDRVAFCSMTGGMECGPADTVTGQRTDDDGKVQITMTGLAQPIELSPAAKAFTWTAPVKAQINLKDSKEAGDLQAFADAFGIAVSVLTLDEIGALTQTAAAIAYRYFFWATAMLPVKDWTETLTLGYELSKQREYEIIYVNDRKRVTGHEDWSMYGEIPLEESPEDGGYVGDGSLRFVVVKGTRNSFNLPPDPPGETHCTFTASPEPVLVHVVVTFDSHGSPTVRFSQGVPWESYWSQTIESCDDGSGGKRLFWVSNPWGDEDDGVWQSGGVRGVFAQRHRRGYDNKPDELIKLIAE